jgi:hypothetical protein
MTQLDELKNQARQQREHYIAALTEVAIQALHDSGLDVKHGSKGHEELHDAIETAARGY